MSNDRPRRNACPTCGRVPRYYGRRELARFVYTWRALLDAGDVLRVQIELRRVITELEGECLNCGVRPRT